MVIMVGDKNRQNLVEKEAGCIDSMLGLHFHHVVLLAVQFLLLQ